jgi:pyruvate dehydrogenase E2 component (dihydrolipoamide acetyltransferase)
MATPVEVPKLGNTVEECIISRWVKRVGDTVAAGELVVEIETDKATFEVTAPVSGTLLATFFEQGALAPVFSNLFVIGEAGESIDAFRAATEKPTTSEQVHRVAPREPVAEAAGQGTVSAGKRSFSPRARRFAEEHDFYPESVIGSGIGGRVLEQDLRHLYHSSPRASTAAKQQMRSGAVRAQEGSGLAGMILSTDVGPSAASISNIRKTIGRRMRESLSTTAQYTLNASADAGGLLTLRARIKASTGVPDININDMVTFCTVKALLEVPDLNAEFVEERIVRHSDVHIGFAVDTPRGLMVPVIRNADRMTVDELASNMKALTEQAVQGTLAPDNMSGATFTISNLGGLGIESFTPVLNPPQVAILGVGAIQLKPARRQGKVEFIDIIGLSLTCDHQVIDGAPGARFLKVVKEKIENVESLCTI